MYLFIYSYKSTCWNFILKGCQKFSFVFTKKWKTRRFANNTAICKWNTYLRCRSALFLRIMFPFPIQFSFLVLMIEVRLWLDITYIHTKDGSPRCLLWEMHNIFSSPILKNHRIDICNRGALRAVSARCSIKSACM